MPGYFHRQTMGATNQPHDLLPGTLDLLVLRTLERGPMHGYGIAQHLLTTTRERSAGGRELALPGAAAPAAERLGQGRVGHLRQQPAGALLHADRRRPQAAGRRARWLRPDRRRDSAAYSRPELALVPSISVFLRRLVYLLTHGRAERELAEELQFHREMASRALQRAGVPDEDVTAAVEPRDGQHDARARGGTRRVDCPVARRALAGSPPRRQEPSPEPGPPDRQRVIHRARHRPQRDAVRRREHRLPASADDGRSGPVVGVEPGNANQFSYPDYRDLVASRTLRTRWASGQPR